MLEIRHIPKVGIQVAHYGNDAFSDLIAFIPVFQGNTMIDHLLYMTAVFRNNELLSLSIVFKIVYQNKFFKWEVT
jgi:hypothetical protein